MKILAFLLSFIPFCASAQSAAFPATQIQPANITIQIPCQQQNLPRNGGRTNLVICPLTITPPPIKIPAITIPVSLSGTNLNFTITLTAAQLAAIQSGNSITGVTIQLTKP